VSPKLAEMARDEEALISGVRDLLRQFYARQLELADQQATAAQLAESFSEYGYTGSTLRKAITFFLNMARYSDVPLSHHFRAPAQRSGAAMRPRRAPQRPKSVTPTSQAQPEASTAAERTTITLRSGGTVTLSCSVAFLAMSREDR